MATDAQPADDQPRLTGSVPLYTQPEPLSLNAHGNLGLVREGNQHLEFVRNAHFVPLTAIEFPAACAFFPIIFLGEEHTPVAVLGLREGQNVYVRENGQWDPFAYVPGYVRRYPFVFAGNNENDQVVVCIDRAYPQIRENADLPFFVDGQPTDLVRNAIEFLRNFEQNRVETEAFVKDLMELDLFTDLNAVYHMPAINGAAPSSTPVAQYRGLSEPKVRELGADKLKELVDKNYLPLIYAHLLSLNNWTQIVNRSRERGFVDIGAAPATTPGAPAPVAETVETADAPAN